MVCVTSLIRRFFILEVSDDSHVPRRHHITLVMLILLMLPCMLCGYPWYTSLKRCCRCVHVTTCNNPVTVIIIFHYRVLNKHHECLLLHHCLEACLLPFPITCIMIQTTISITEWVGGCSKIAIGLEGRNDAGTCHFPAIPCLYLPPLPSTIHLVVRYALAPQILSRLYEL